MSFFMIKYSLMLSIIMILMRAASYLCQTRNEFLNAYNEGK